MRALVLFALLAAPVLASDDYAAVLKRVVKSDGVDYAALRKDRAPLDRYVASLAKAAPGATDAARIAFWINAYNALTLQHVLDTRKAGDRDYSVNEVPGFWTKRTWTVAGREVTLDGIEKGILLKGFDEPRVHFAVNCASRSCPPLQNTPFRADTLDADLTRQTRAYLADTRENRFHVPRQHAEVSRIFKWYRGDFEPLQEFLARYAPTETQRRSLAQGRWKITYLPYDWSLNEAGVARGERREAPGPLWLLLYLVPVLALLGYGFHAFKLMRWRKRDGEAYREQLAAARADSALGRTVFPRVLVQVPVYNEPGVVERAIDAVAALDYPNLEIQVLDDSTDATVALVDRAAARHPRVAVLRRPHREGFKAGALAAGLARSDAEFVAIFDADFVPEPDFLRRALPLFDAPGRVACVQGRWEHLNRNQNRLTRAQAVGVDAHFFIQQFARAAAGVFLNFNGTAGVWRRAAIADAGGWRGDTLTEDLDLSYRAQLRGWRIVFDPGLAVPAELPPTLGAYKSQQRRWACGSIQCARRFLGAVWRSRLPWRVKTEAAVHLCGYLVCVAMSMLILLLPAGIGHLPVLAHYPGYWPAWLAIWAAAAGPITLSAWGQRVRGRIVWRDVLGAFLLGLGSCANNAIAALRGFMRPIRTFVRTPKQGRLEAPARSPAPRLEQVMAAFTLGSVALLAFTAPWAVATYAFFCAGGFLAVVVYWWVAEA